MASLRNKAFLQSQTLTYVNLQQQHQNQAQHMQHKGRTPAMIPASVQRQLQKNSSNADQKKDKLSQSPTEGSQENAEGQSDVASQLKKMQMQQNYTNMVQAMNSGVQWRGNGASGQPQHQQQLPANVQMLMAQHQQAAQMHHMKMMMMSRQQQQHLLMAKLAQMQQHQQQQQAMQHANNLQERHVQNQQHQSQAVPTELSQVVQENLNKVVQLFIFRLDRFRRPSRSCSHRLEFKVRSSPVQETECLRPFDQCHLKTSKSN